MAGPEVGKGKIPIEPDTDGFGAKLRRGIDDESGGVPDAFGKIGHMAGNAFKLAAVAAAAGAVAAIAFSKQAVDAASNQAEAMSKVTVVFGDQAVAIQEWSDTSAEAFGQSKTQALEAAGTYGNLFKAFGVNGDAAAGMSQSLVELAADLASFNNTSIEDALAAIQSGISGETEPLKRYGAVLSDVRLKEEALAQGLISSTKDALTPAAKAQAAYALIMKDTALAQGDFARTSDGLANQQRIMAAKFEDTKAVIGKALLPVMLALVSFIADKIIPAVQKLAEEWMPKLQAAFSSIGDWIKQNWPAIRDAVVSTINEIIDRGRALWQWFVVNILPGLTAAFAEVVGWLQRNWPQIQQIVADVLAAIGVAITWIAQEVMPRLVDAITTVVRWFRDDFTPVVRDVVAWINDNLVPAFMAVVTWLNGNVVPAVQAVVGWIREHLIPAMVAIVLWINENLVPAFQAIVRFISDKLVPAFQTVVSVVMEKVIPTIANIISKFNEVASNVGTKVGEIVGFITGIPARISGTIDGLWDGLKNGITGAKDWVKNRIDDVVEFATALPGRMSGIFGGMWDGIKNAFRSAINVVIRGWNSLQFTVPGVSAFGVTVGGFTIGTPDIRELATGAVIDQPTIAMLGEYRNAARNPEIVAPQNMMADTFRDVLRDFEPMGRNPIGQGPLVNELHVGDRRDLPDAMEALDRVMWASRVGVAA